MSDKNTSQCSMRMSEKGFTIESDYLTSINSIRIRYTNRKRIESGNPDGQDDGIDHGRTTSLFFGGRAGGGNIIHNRIWAYCKSKFFVIKASLIIFLSKCMCKFDQSDLFCKKRLFILFYYHMLREYEYEDARGCKISFLKTGDLSPSYQS